MKKLVILLSVAVVSFSQAQKQINQDIQVEKSEKENIKNLKTDPDARVFMLEDQNENSSSNKYVLTKKEVLENKKGYRRVNTAINKANKAQKKEERKRLKAQNKMLDRHLKEQRKREKNNTHK